MKITRKQLRSIIKEEVATATDGAVYDEAYEEIMMLVSELGSPGPYGKPDPAVQGAIYNALIEVAKELETEMKMASEQGPRR